MMAIVASVMAVVCVALVLVAGWRFKLAARTYWRRSVVVIGLIALGVGASWLPLVRSDATQVVTNADIIFLVDTTYSMNALDGKGGGFRLADVRQDIKTFSEKLAGSRIGIVTYDSAATIYLPLTATTSDIAIAADTIQTKQYIESSQDPNLTKALEDTKAYLDEAAKVDSTRQRLLVVMTDGELTGSTDSTDKVTAAARKIATSVNASVVLGYGTEAGGKLPYLVDNFDTYSQERLSLGITQFENNTFSPVLSKRDQTFLRTFAGALNGTYVDASQSGDALSALTQGRQIAADRQANQPQNRSVLQNILHVPMALLIAALLVASEIIGLPRVRQLFAKRSKA